MKIATIVGARPQFIKAAMVSPELRKQHTEILIHTGQHYDKNMSDTFFEELNIPKPDYNLGISGGSHAEMTGNMMVAIEKVLLKEKPDWVLVYGDTNSTLAGALTASKLYIPVCHVEAGTRVHSRTNPEEINRICTDHVSTKLLYCTPSAEKELKNEGLFDKAFLVGDPMYDAFLKYSLMLSPGDFKLTTLEGNEVSVPHKYYYLTCHREENTHDDVPLTEIMKAMNSLDASTVYPVHPRNSERAIRIKKRYGLKNIILSEPIGYKESVCLVNNSLKIVTDSGGVQREAFFAGKKCVSVLDFVIWPETMVDNRNSLAKPNENDIIEKLDIEQIVDDGYQPFGNGKAGYKITMSFKEQ